MFGLKGPIFKAKIKRGTAIFHDHGFYQWPECKAPGGHIKERNIDLEFDCQGSVETYWLVAPGYGQPRDYGNGSIGVTGIDGLIIANADRDRIVSDMIAERSEKVAKLDAEIAKLRKEIQGLRAA